jgi:hypothetical protein
VPQHSTNSTNLADLLERVLDKGVVIAGDVKIKLVDIELLSIQVRLVICSVERAKEMGMDWWSTNPAFCSNADANRRALEAENQRLEARLAALETRLAETKPLPAAVPIPAAPPQPMTPQTEVVERDGRRFRPVADQPAHPPPEPEGDAA